MDAFLGECLPHLSRRQIHAALRAGAFQLHGRTAKKGDRLSVGDELRFHGPLFWLSETPAPSEEDLIVVYEDSAILAVNKPAGMATHGFSGRDIDTLANRLLANWPDLLSVGKSRWEPGIVHRLDRDTSGVLLIAKTQDAFERLREQFSGREVIKIYCALVWGNTPSRGGVDLPLTHDRSDKRRMRAISGAGRPGERVWEAITRYRCIGQAHGVSLLEVVMKTGVTHQIRAHLAALGHPIVGDTLYGNSQSEQFGLARHFLHAHKLGIVHPETKKPVTIIADLPNDLTAVLRGLDMER